MIIILSRWIYLLAVPMFNNALIIQYNKIDYHIIFTAVCGPNYRYGQLKTNTNNEIEIKYYYIL